MRREYTIPKGIIRVSSITLDNRAVIAVPYDMRNGFAVEMKVAASGYQGSTELIGSPWIISDTADGQQSSQGLSYEFAQKSVSIRCNKSSVSNSYAQFRNVINDTLPHIVKASNQYNYNGEHYRLIFDGQTKSVSWSTGTPLSYWENDLTLFIVARDGYLTTVHYCKLYDKWGQDGLENVVNDLVPIGNTETGEGGLLDLLTGDLYWNINEGGQITYTL